AIRAQGFLLPQSEHVLIHLRPSHQKKSSRGLDLAIAALYLWHTEQIPKPLELNENTYVYGELTLEGRVMMPEDLRYLDTSDRVVITGAGDFATGPYLRVEDVKALQSPIPVAEGSAVTLPIRPSW